MIWDTNFSSILNGQDAEVYICHSRCSKLTYGSQDKRGLPVYVFEVAPLNSKRMEAYSKSSTSTNVLHSKKDHTKNNGDIPPRLYRLFALYENMIKCILPFCTALRDRPSPETPISQSNNIVDISGVGLKQFWNLRSHMQEASVLATAHYPETLDRIFVSTLHYQQPL